MKNFTPSRPDRIDLLPIFLISNTYHDIDKHIRYQQRHQFNDLIIEFFKDTLTPESKTTIDPKLVTRSYNQINGVITTFFGDTPVVDTTLATIKSSLSTLDRAAVKYFGEDYVVDPSLAETFPSPQPRN